MCGGDAVFLSNYFDHLLLLGRIAVLCNAFLHSSRQSVVMRPIVTDRVARSVGLSDPLSSCQALQKTAEPIEMPFGFTIRVGHRNHMLDVVQVTMGRGSYEGRNRRCVVKGL